MADALLEVRDLRTYIYTRRGVVKAVDGASFSVRRGETLGDRRGVGLGQVDDVPLDPAAACPSRAAASSAADPIRRRGSPRKSPDEMRRLRGARIAMILQDPMASLNPAFTVGEQIAETLRAPSWAAGPGARPARGRAPAAGADQRSRAARARLPAPDERRHPPARGRRHRHLLPAEPADRRRADDLARRHDPGPVPPALEGHPARDQPGARSSSPTTSASSPSCATGSP